VLLLVLVLVQWVALSSGAPSASGVVGDYGHTGSCDPADPTVAPCMSAAGAVA